MINQTFFENLANIVLQHRKKSGLNRVKLARLAGVGKSAVFDIEHGKKTIQLDTLVKILDVLNISIQITSPLMQTVKESDHEKG